MLQTLKKSKTLKNLYGINSGNYGFLMNKFSENLIRFILKSKSINISPLEMTANTELKKLKV